MPRIRTLKPDHRQHRKVGALTDRQYRLWVGMICEADDEGRLVADADQLRVIVFGYHPKVRVSDVADALVALCEAGLVELYTVGDTRYAAFPSWRDHQRIDRPQPSKLPSPQHSTNGREPSPMTLEGSEGKGREGIKEGNGALHGQGVEHDPSALAAFSQADRQFLEATPEPYRSQWLGAPAWWLSLGDGYPGVNLQREASKYMAYQDSQSAGQKHRNVRKGLRAWVAKAARWAEQEAMRKAVRR